MKIKNTKTLAFIAFALTSQSALAASVTGTCILKDRGTLQDSFELTNTDPVDHYGMIAEGFSEKGDRVYLEKHTQKEGTEIMAYIQSVGGSSYVIIPVKRKDKMVRVHFGTYLKSFTGFTGEKSSKGWLSCDLSVKL